VQTAAFAGERSHRPRYEADHPAADVKDEGERRKVLK